jgi:hypothetical protein
MLPRIKRVQHLREYRLALTFTNGQTGEVDLRERIVGRGGVFQPLEDMVVFQQVQVDPESGTLVWPNGVDLDPDVLYSKTMNVPLPGLVQA